MSSTAAERAAGDTVMQLVTFRLKDETYGINVMQVQEVLRVTEIAPVPGAAAFVLGIINLRGNVVTVIDTRTRFGLPTAEVDDASRIVMDTDFSKIYWARQTEFIPLYEMFNADTGSRGKLLSRERFEHIRDWTDAFYRDRGDLFARRIEEADSD